MRHRKGFNHLGRTSSHRKAMLANMASSLILHKRIQTTTAKAKALRSYVEPLITRSKEDTTHSRRVVFSYLKDKHAVSELFREVSPKVAERPGGYTRILKTGRRLGDNADMCIIELVDFNENMLAATAESKAKSSRRGRRGGRKKSSPQAPAETTTGAATAEANVSGDKSVPEVKDQPDVTESAVEEKSEEKQVADESQETTVKAEGTKAVEVPVEEKPVEEKQTPEKEEPKAQEKSEEDGEDKSAGEADKNDASGKQAN